MATKKATKAHPNHEAKISRLRRIKGQIEGIEKMITERRYCPDLLIQLRAVRAAVKSLEGQVLETHLRHCVKDAMTSSSTSEQDKKIEELMDLFQRS